jgi:dephospho-CoA kinase
MLRDLGAPIVDADAVAREVVEPGTPALAEIVARWGPRVLGPDGRLDRKRLGAIAFADPAERRALEAITHPRIAAASQQRIAAHAAAGAPVVVYEAALLVERGLHRGMDALIVVSASPAAQKQRLMARDGLSAAEADARLAAQLPLADKLAAADHVVDNSGSIDETRRRVEDIWREILER